MTKQLRTNATNARKDFFNLIDQVAYNNLQVFITKKGLDSPIVLTNPKKTSKALTNLKNQTDIVTNTAGSIKTSGYISNEFELAQQIFKKNYNGK